MGGELCVLLRHILSLYYFSLLLFYMIRPTIILMIAILCLMTFSDS